MAKIALAVGHTLSGSDSGAVGMLNESVCTREIGQYAKQYLEARGHQVVYCRIDRASSVNASLSYRVNLANNSNADLYCEIHLNAGGGVGTETYCLDFGGEGEKVARQIVTRIAALGYVNRGVKSAGFYVLRNTKMPAVLVECCFVDNGSDVQKYNAKALGEAIAQGLINSNVNTPSVPKTSSEGVQSIIGGFKEMVKEYKNGSTPENVYCDAE